MACKGCFRTDCICKHNEGHNCPKCGKKHGEGSCSSCGDKGSSCPSCGKCPHCSNK